MNIGELMAGIKKKDIVLPEFQREFVWTLEQSKQLMVSLIRKYPTGSLLFWKTENPPEIKNLAVDRDKLGSKEVILDGQQRLTTLYLFLGTEFTKYAHIGFEEKDEKTVCKITVERAPQPVFFMGLDGAKEFYLRAGNTTRMLDSKETHEYIQMHWEA